VAALFLLRALISFPECAAEKLFGRAAELVMRERSAHRKQH